MNYSAWSRKLAVVEDRRSDVRPPAAFTGRSSYLPTAPTRDKHRRARRLNLLPLFDRGAIKAPIASNAEAGKPSLAQQPVYRCRVDAEVIRQFFNRENFVLGGHVYVPQINGMDLAPPCACR